MGSFWKGPGAGQRRLIALESAAEIRLPYGQGIVRNGSYPNGHGPHGSCPVPVNTRFRTTETGVYPRPVGIRDPGDGGPVS